MIINNRTILVFFLCVLVIGCKSQNKEINKILNETALDINISTPVMIDNNTLFDGATVSADNVFTYNYTVLNTSNPDSLIKEVESVLKEKIKQEYATNPQLAFFKQNNVVVEYVYNDENGQIISVFRLNPDDY